MKDKILENWKYLILGLLALNLVVLDVWLVKQVMSSPPSPETSAGKKEEGISFGGEETVIPALLPTGFFDTCGLVCQEKIAEEVARVMATVSGERVVETKTVVKEVAPASAGYQAKVAYVPLVASASNTKTDWTDIAPSEFYFDLASYLGVKTVRFTGYLRAVHATGPVYVRLYDASNLRGVDNSDFSTSSNSFQRFESAPLSIWRGNNLYRVQLRSPTVTEAQVSEVKLKIEW